MITPSFGITAAERVLPKLALDFTTASLDGRITFTRTTGASNPATYANSSGLITAATNNQPRFDYDPVTLACKGLLIEESRTNLQIYSEQFDNASWTKTTATITANAAVAPDGNTTAERLDATAANGRFYQNSPTGITNGINYTLSIFVKKGTSDTCRVDFSGTDSGPVWTFSTESFAVRAGWTTSFQKYPNGWYRLMLVRQSTNTNGGIQFLVPTSGQTIYIWGAQLEAGAFATSYIPTTLLPLTRNADVATMTGTDFSDWYTAAYVSLYAQWAGTGYSTSRGIVAITDGTTANRIFLGERSTSNVYSRLSAGGTNILVNDTSGAITAGQTVKSAIRIGGGSYSVVTNGALVTSNTTALVPSVNQLKIGQYETGNGQSCTTIQKIMYYAVGLSIAQLQALTH